VRTWQKGSEAMRCGVQGGRYQSGETQTKFGSKCTDVTKMKTQRKHKSIAILHLIAIGKRGYCHNCFDFTIAGTLVSLTFKSLTPGFSTFLANNTANLSNCGHTTSNQSAREQPKTTAD